MDNQKKTAKEGLSIMKLSGGIFLCLGILTLGAALLLLLFGCLIPLFSINGMSLDDTIPIALILLSVFAILGVFGLGLTIAGAVMLVSSGNKTKVQNNVLKRDFYVMADVQKIYKNRFVKYFGRFPWVVECTYQAPNGRIFTFKSRNLLFDPNKVIENNQVRVYVDPNNYANYYVDIDEPKEN